MSHTYKFLLSISREVINIHGFWKLKFMLKLWRWKITSKMKIIECVRRTLFFLILFKNIYPFTLTHVSYPEKKWAAAESATGKPATCENPSHLSPSYLNDEGFGEGQNRKFTKQKTLLSTTCNACPLDYGSVFNF